MPEENGQPLSTEQTSPLASDKEEVPTSQPSVFKTWLNNLRSRKVLLLVLTLVILLIIGFLGFWLFQKDRTESPSAPAPVSVFQPQKIPPGWEVYQNEKFGFVLGFPQSWADFEVKADKREGGSLSLPFEFINFEVTGTQRDGRDYSFRLTIYTFSHEWWTSRRLEQQTKKYFLSSGLPLLPYLDENENYVFSWQTNSGIPASKEVHEELEEEISQAREKEAEDIIATFEVIDPVERDPRWENYFNPKGCPDFPETDFTNQCYLDSLQGLTSPRVCAQVRPDYEDFCYYRAAWNLEEATACGQLSTLLNREICYRHLASASENVGLCQQIQTEKERDECYLEIAKLSKDIAICNQISSRARKNSCYALVNPTQPVSPVPPISQWETYTNEKQGYAFKHPPGWEFKANQISGEIEPLRVIRETLSNQTPTSVWRWFIKIDTWDNPAKLSLLDWLESRGEPGGFLSEEMPFQANTFVGEEKIEALQSWQGGTSTWDQPGTPIQAPLSLEVYFVHGDKGYRVTLQYSGEIDQESQDVFEQILATLSFL